MMACSIKSDDSSIISEESRAVATADDDDEEDDAKHRHSNDNATTETNYDSQEILDRIGKYPAEYHNRCPHSEEREIPHIRQDETWDCGLTCVQMILQWLRADVEDVVDDLEAIDGSSDEGAHNSIRQGISNIEKAWMIEFVASKSIWTIDLVMLLQYILSCTPRTSTNNTTIDSAIVKDERECSLGFQVNLPQNFSYLFCSTKFEVEKSYSNLDYYQDAFPLDELRIQKLFDMAHGQNLPMLQTTHLNLQVLVDVISHKGVVAIVLLDNVILRNLPSSEYSGHYVILCGISYDEDLIHYAQLNYPDENDNTPNYDFCIAIKNPGSWKHVEYVTPSIFEEAWRARGTDEDVIFIAKHAQDMNA